MYISLTGEKSHKLNIPAGQGSFSIGTKGMSKGKYDIWVEKDCALNWDAFNECFTPYGQQNVEKHPYGDWPRFFYYSGNDTGFIKWAEKRPIEDFYWMPQENVSIDLTKSNINSFFVDAEKNKIEIITGDKIRVLSLSGNLRNFDVIKCTIIPSIYFSPLCSKEATSPYELPIYRALEKATSVDIKISPIGQAFDCKSLLQFQNLKNLNLAGNLTNLEALSELKLLERIGLRHVPNLHNMPKLVTWKHLQSFIGWNIEETAGRALRAELRKMSKEKVMEYSSVTKLRKSIWFTTEYGIPFSGWEDKNAKIATKAYKNCLKEIKKSKTVNEVQNAIFGFIESLNELTDIETSEREDVGIAVNQLIESSDLGISQETGIAWFDEIRDF